MKQEDSGGPASATDRLGRGKCPCGHALTIGRHLRADVPVQLDRGGFFTTLLIFAGSIGVGLST